MPAFAGMTALCKRYSCESPNRRYPVTLFEGRTVGVVIPMLKVNASKGRALPPEARGQQQQPGRIGFSGDWSANIVVIGLMS
jgi:hypothetical protein